MLHTIPQKSNIIFRYCKIIG